MTNGAKPHDTKQDKPEQQKDRDVKTSTQVKNARPKKP